MCPISAVNFHIKIHFKEKNEFETPTPKNNLEL